MTWLIAIAALVLAWVPHQHSGYACSRPFSQRDYHWVVSIERNDSSKIVLFKSLNLEHVFKTRKDSNVDLGIAVSSRPFEDGVCDVAMFSFGRLRSVLSDGPYKNAAGWNDAVGCDTSLVRNAKPDFGAQRGRVAAIDNFKSDCCSFGIALSNLQNRFGYRKVGAHLRLAGFPLASNRVLGGGYGFQVRLEGTPHEVYADTSRDQTSKRPKGSENYREPRPTRRFPLGLKIAFVPPIFAFGVWTCWRGLNMGGMRDDGFWPVAKSVGTMVLGAMLAASPLLFLLW